MRRWLLVPLLGLSGCALLPGHGCYDMAVWDSLAVRFDPPLDSGSTWEVDVRGDVLASCAVALPVTDPNAADSGLCDAANDAGVWSEFQLSQNRTVAHSYRVIGAAPASVHVRLLRDGQLVAAQDFTPGYTPSEPNGPGCGTVYDGDVVMQH